MHKFVLFLKKIYVLLLFIVLEVAALNYYSNSNDYTKARRLSATNKVVGGIYRQFAKIDDYFGLRRENDALVERIARMHNELEGYKMLLPDTMDAQDLLAGGLADYEYMTASVINNSIMRPENFLILDKGQRDGVAADMAVVTPEGTIVGYVMHSTEKFSTAISLLNVNFRTSGRIRGKDFFGSVYWNGFDHSYVTLSEVSKYADIARGDTIETVHSSIFPPDVVIGTVEDFTLTQASYYDIKVRLATSFATLDRVLLVHYADIAERKALEEQFGGQGK